MTGQKMVLAGGCIVSNDSRSGDIGGSMNRKSVTKSLPAKPEADKACCGGQRKFCGNFLRQPVSMVAVLALLAVMAAAAEAAQPVAAVVAGQREPVELTFEAVKMANNTGQAAISLNRNAAEDSPKQADKNISKAGTDKNLSMNTTSQAVTNTEQAAKSDYASTAVKNTEQAAKSAGTEQAVERKLAASQVNLRKLSEAHFEFSINLYRQKAKLQEQ